MIDLIIEACKKKEGHDSRAVANRFVEIALREKYTLTGLRLNNFVYFAHGWTLGHEGKPLIKHSVEIWSLGPAIPEVYNAFGGSKEIKEKAKRFPGKEYDFEEELSESQAKIIEDVFREYSGLRFSEMKKISAGQGTPWGRYQGRLFVKIPDHEIGSYYSKVIYTAKKRDEEKDEQPVDPNN